MLIALNTLLINADDATYLAALRTVASTLLCKQTLLCNVVTQPASRRRLQGSSTDIVVTVDRLRSAAAAESSTIPTAEAFSDAIAANPMLPAGSATLTGMRLEALSADVNVVTAAGTAGRTGDEVDSAKVASLLSDPGPVSVAMAPVLPKVTPASIQVSAIAAPPGLSPQQSPPPSPSSPLVLSPSPTPPAVPLDATLSLINDGGEGDDGNENDLCARNLDPNL